MLMWPSAVANTPVGNAGRMIVARLLRHLVRNRPARRLEIQHRDLRRQQRALHPLALARLLAFEQAQSECPSRRKCRPSDLPPEYRRAPAPVPAGR